MTDDYEVTRTVWDAKVPIEFCLDTSEFVLRSAQSFYAMLPRVTYFPLCISKALQFFCTSVDEVDDVKDAWLQHSGESLKWHYPVGVLYDLFVPEQSTPWIVTIRLKNFPDELIRGTKESMRNCFLQSLKEADYLKHKGNVMSTMHSDEHLRLFESVANERFDDFWSVNKKLMSTSEGGFANIPVRFYELGTPFRQSLVPPAKDNKETTLEEVLRSAYPDYDLSQYSFVSHGISLPLETPVMWMSKNLSYPDNFVHVVLKRHLAV